MRRALSLDGIFLRALKIGLAILAVTSFIAMVIGIIDTERETWEYTPSSTTTLPTTTTTPAPEGVITTTTTVPVVTLPRVGWFIPGWEPVYPAGTTMAQTYVNVCNNYLYHRLNYMRGLPAFVYVQAQGNTIDDIIDGTLDDCWLSTLASMPADAIFAPIAEANGMWVSYYGTVEQVAAAYARIRELDAGRHRMCGSFTIMANVQPYMDAVKDSVDLWCPSAYDTDGRQDVPSKVRSTVSHGLPVLLAQTGTVRDDKVGWLSQLLEDLDGTVVGVIYFNQHQYTIEGVS